MSDFSGSIEPCFDEISILIPGYSVEDLPSDLDEDAAEGLLNAFAVAWHPQLLLLSRQMPAIRQADSLHQLTGRHLLLVPPYSEDWMSHDWRDGATLFLHSVLAQCQQRSEWLTAVDSLISELAGQPAKTEGDPSAEPPQHDAARQSEAANVCEAGDIGADADAVAVGDFDKTEAAGEFMSLGVTWLLTMLSARRMHHFVDPDENLLSSEVHKAAEAWLRGDALTMKKHLTRCFELLLETRERFYPLPCYLVDICLPSSDADAELLCQEARRSSSLNILTTGRDLKRWLQKSAALADTIRDRQAAGQLQILSGHAVEVRSSLGLLTATLSDLEVCHDELTDELQIPIQHWARKRFGLLSSLPMLLSHFGFQSACHVALDDGLYPDKERSQFDWQAPSGAFLSATSRIPLAIDSAASLLRLPDRLQESMQDDSVAVLYLARLPALKTPWLQDLKTAAAFGPVLGEFVTVGQLADLTVSQRNRLKFDHSEYLSPYLIQASVLKTESPISGPASLSQLWSKLEQIFCLRAVRQMLRSALNYQNDSDDQPDSLQAELESNQTLTEITDRLLTLENEHAEFRSALEKPSGPQISAVDDPVLCQLQTEEKLLTKLQTMATGLSQDLLEMVGDSVPGVKGLFLVNTLPFARLMIVDWPGDWKLPAVHPALEAVAGTAQQARPSHPAEASTACAVKIPPGGYVWLMESSSARQPAAIFRTERREPPLAEGLTLRNRHFEVTLSERHGGIESVIFHGTRINRVSQHVAWRYEREQRVDGARDALTATHYCDTRCLSHSVQYCDSLRAAVETMFELVSPVDGRRLACGRQTVSVDRFQPVLSIRIYFDVIDTEVKGNPWMEYLACRFAWDNEMAAITRSVWGQVAGFRAERFESPDYIEVADEDRRLLVIPHGRPYHRRSGPRMLDSLLLCEGERSRQFEFTLAFDQPFPMRQSLDATTALVQTTTRDLDPHAGTHAWLWGVSAKNIMVVRLRAAEDYFEKPGIAGTVRILLMETEGMIAECTIRTALTARSARLISHDGTMLQELEVTDSGIVLLFNRFELREVEIQF